MGSVMANSLEDAMLRLERLESDVGDIKGAVVNMSAILLRHEGRLDHLSDRMDTMCERMDTMCERMDTMCERMDTMCDQQTLVIERLDRLIEVTIIERTRTTERMGDFERRLTRLEEHVGLPKV
jgi:uncharacterized coiled-coil protein SlyX